MPTKPGSDRLRISDSRLAFGPLVAHRAADLVGDTVVLAGLVVLLYIGVRLALGAPDVIKGRGISLSPAVTRRFRWTPRSLRPRQDESRRYFGP